MTDSNSECTACQLTGTGKSAVAVIGLRGPNADSILSACFQPASKRAFEIGQVRYGQWTGARANAPSVTTESSDDPVAVAESVVITPKAADEYEVHCHGGRAAVERVLQDLTDAGVRVIPHEQWDKQTMSPLQREATWMLRRCMTTRTARIAYSQLRREGSDGDSDSSVSEAIDSSELESGIPQDACPLGLAEWIRRYESGLNSILSSEQRDRTLEELRADAQRVVDQGRWTVRMHRPFDVALVGPPNVGKSTLVNALVGYQRSITYDQPGTTRDLLYAETVLEGIPFRLIDTAGLRIVNESSAVEIPMPSNEGHQQTGHGQKGHGQTDRVLNPEQAGGQNLAEATDHGQIERRGIAKVDEVLATTDLVLLIEDHREDSDETWADRRAALASRMQNSRVPVLWVRSKADLQGAAGLPEGAGPSGTDANVAECGNSGALERDGLQSKESDSAGDLGTSRDHPIRTAAPSGRGVPELGELIVDAVTHRLDSRLPIATHERQVAWLVELSTVETADQARKLLSGLASERWPE